MNRPINFDEIRRQIAQHPHRMPMPPQGMPPMAHQGMPPMAPQGMPPMAPHGIAANGAIIEDDDEDDPERAADLRVVHQGRQPIPEIRIVNQINRKRRAHSRESSSRSRRRRYSKSGGRKSRRRRTVRRR